MHCCKSISDNGVTSSGETSPMCSKEPMLSLFDHRGSVAPCTHRPALPTVRKQLAKHMPAGLATLLPASDPFLAPGEIIVCQVSASSNDRIVSVEQYRPCDDRTSQTGPYRRSGT